MNTITKEMQQKITPDEAFQILVEGNKRFLNNQKIDRDLLKQAAETSNGQHPIAVILSCIDSRTSAELIFDLGLGDVFSIRIAGNVINDDILGSMEFACKVAGSKIILVLGHSQCGAVKGACDQVDMGNLTTLLNKIQPAIEDENTVQSNRSGDNPEFVEKVIINNVKHAMNEIIAKSSVIKEMLENNDIKLIGGYHELSTGEVNFNI